MRRPTTYEQTLERLKTQGTREQECFSRAVTALRDKGTAAEFSATITDARAAIDKLVQEKDARIGELEAKAKELHALQQSAGGAEKAALQRLEVYNLAAQSHVKISFDVPEYTANTDANGVLYMLFNFT